MHRQRTKSSFPIGPGLNPTAHRRLTHTPTHSWGDRRYMAREQGWKHAAKHQILSFARRAGVRRVSRQRSRVCNRVPLMTQSQSLPRRTYTPSQLLQLRNKPCVCPSRIVRRKLFYFNLLTRHIPTITTSRHETSKPAPHFPRARTLQKVKREQLKRAPRRQPVPLPNVVLTNVQSLCNKMDEVGLLMSRLNPDIAVYIETWLNDTIGEAAVKIDGYATVRKDRENGRGGGIMCYMRDSYSFDIIGEPQVTSLKCIKTEILCLFIKELFLFVIAVYHPFWNNNVADLEALTCIVELIDYAFLKYGSNVRIILCGDFNDLRLRFSEISSLTRLTAVVNFPTRGEHVLDQIFVNFSVSDRALKYPPVGCSDHSVIFWSPSPLRKPVVRKKVVRRFSHAKLFSFRSTVSHIDWISLISFFDDFDDSVSYLTTCLVTLFEHFFPTRTIRIRSSDPEWMRDSLKILIDDRDRAFYLGNWSKYSRLRKEVVLHIRFLKIFLSNASAAKSPKTTWKAIRSVAHFSRSSSASRFLPEDFSDFFASNFATDSSQSPLSTPFLDKATDRPEVSVIDVFHCMKKLKSKGAGADGLAPWILKDCAFFLAPVITSLINKSLSLGKFPKCLKFANITPIPKTSHPTSVADFRPISILPALSKVFERIVLTKLILPDVSSLIQPSQFAYIPRPGTGTTSPLVLLYHHILHFLDSSSGAVRVLSVDFSKAFDKLSHSVIIDACCRLGLNSVLIKWISSFLSDRMQRVVCSGSVSPWTQISSGVPQGSVLGPILFCFVVDHLSPVCSNTEVVKYADDVVFLHFLRTPNDDHLQLEWNSLVKWSDNFFLPINFSKCKVMDFITKKDFILSPIHIFSDTYVTSVSSLTFLGVCISNDFKWNCHFDNMINKAAKRLFVLRNLRRSDCPIDLMWKVYESLLRSLFIYSSACFCNAPSYLFDKLLLFERRVCRILNISPNSCPSVTSVMDKMCKKLFNQVVQSPSHPLRVLFEQKVQTRTRSNCVFRHPRCSTKRFRNSFIKYCT